MTAKRDYFLKLRSYPDCRFASLWICCRQGPAEECLLFGELIPQLAEEVILALGLPTEREKSPLVGLEPIRQPDCATVPKQGELFS